MGFTIRPIGEDEVGDFQAQLVRAFGSDLDEDERQEASERFTSTVDLARTRAAYADGELVGTSAAYDLEISVPGGVVPMGGVTMISVQPTHTRRGILRELVAAHLADHRERGEPLSGLWASETAIYGRFGYGVSSHRYDVEVDTRTLGWAPEAPDELRLVDVDTARKLLPSIYEATLQVRPGMVGRSEAWWTHRRLADPPRRREGSSSLRHVVAFRDGQPTGYAAYRQREQWETFVPEGKISVSEVISPDPQARLSLWAYLCSVDLFPKVAYWNAPVDFALPWAVPEARRITRKPADGIHLRILDVPAALEARSYPTEGALVIEVGGVDRAPPGLYELEVSSGRAICRPSRAKSPHVSLEATALAALYLGAGDAWALAGAGRVEGSPEAIRKLHHLMSWTPAAWCPEVF